MKLATVSATAIAVISMFSSSAFGAPTRSAPNPYLIAVKSGDKNYAQISELYQGKGLVCRFHGASASIGYAQTKKGTLYFYDVVRDLQHKARLASGKKKTTLTRQAQVVKKGLAALTPSCHIAQGVTPTPIPPKDSESLDPYTGPPDAAYLFRKAGYGGNPGALAQIPTASALVDAFMQEKDDSAAAALAGNIAGEVVNNSAPVIPTIADARKALVAWTLNSVNPLQMRLTNFYVRLFAVDACQLSSSGTASALSLNPRETGQYWELIKLYRSYASNTDFPGLVGKVGTSIAMLESHLNNGSVPPVPSELYAQATLDLILGTTYLDSNGNPIPTYTRNMTDGTNRTDDLAKVARRFTGWSDKLVDNGVPGIKIWGSAFAESNHADTTEELFTGTPYAFTADTNVDTIPGIYTHHPAAATRLAELVLKEFVTPNPSTTLIQKMGAELKASGFNLYGPLTKLLKSKAFWYAGYRNAIPRAPLEVLVEATKLLQMQNLATKQIANLDIDIAAASDNPQGGMGFNWACPPQTFYPYEQFGTAGALGSNMVFIGRLLQRGLDDVANDKPPLWSIDGALPGGVLDVPSLTQLLSNEFGVQVSQDQQKFIQFMMDFVINYNFKGNVVTGLHPYDNTDRGDGTGGRLGKGSTLMLLLLSLPAFSSR